MGVEPETRAFFVLIVNSMAWMLLWMVLNVLFGIYLGYAFFDGSPGWKNIIYYGLSLAGFAILIRHLIKKWKQYI